jgi:acyl phosphate:glycerol-3-phosphate acyltransferase
MIAYGILFFIVMSYIFGSIPSGLIIGKVLKGVDIREYGSKNTGATNAVRVLGFKYGIWAFVLDALKGAIVMIYLYFAQLESFYIINGFNITILYGLAAVIGHVFPIYIGFKGGKAVATSAGVIIAIEPIITMISILVFLGMFKKTRIVSLSSTTAAITVIFMFLIRIPIRLSTEKIEHSMKTLLLDMFIILVMGILIFIRHRSNYKRLREGTEHKF